MSDHRTKESTTNEVQVVDEQKALVVKEQYLNPQVWEQMKTMSQTFIQSAALPKGISNAAQAIMVLQAGYEMGMKPIEAMKSLYIVNGVINVWGAAITRRLREHGWVLSYKDAPNTCTATVTKGKETYTETFTFEEAVKSGYTTDSYGKLKVGWKEGLNRKLKLRYGAVSVLIKSYIPEVLGSASDVAEIAEDYPVVEESQPTHEVSDKPKTETIVSSTPEQRSSTLTDFLKKNKTPSETTQNEPTAKIDPKADVVEGEVVKNDSGASQEATGINEEDQSNVPLYNLVTVRKKYFAVAKEFGFGNSEDAKNHIKEIFNVDSFLKLTPGQLIQTINNMEKSIEERKENGN